MSDASSATRAYRSTQIETATPGRLIVLMYDGAIRFLTEANRGLCAGDFYRFSDGLKRAQPIIAELMSSLDMEAGAEIAANLLRVYGFLFDSLTEASLRQEPETVEMVLGHLRTLRGAWEEAERKAAAPAEGQASQSE
jgi:flagellar protein FliS